MIRPNELTDLANRYGSDKGDSVYNKHCYTRVYLEYFQEYKDQPVELCEIGLLHPEAKKLSSGSYDRAPSLFMWGDYFQRGQITGFDIDDFSAVQRERLRIIRGDQSNRDDLARLVLPEGKLYDFIIDDGSHASHHQQISLGYLFKFLRPGGLYIIEDMRWQPPELEHPGAPKTLSVLESLKFHHQANSIFLLPGERQYLENHVAKITFYDSLTKTSFTDALAVIVKK
jgi:hypothetical protein